MIQAYSTNQTILTNGILPFNSTSLKKGNTTTLNGVSSLMLKIVQGHIKSRLI